MSSAFTPRAFWRDAESTNSCMQGPSWDGAYASLSLALR